MGTSPKRFVAWLRGLVAMTKDVPAVCSYFRHMLDSLQHLLSSAEPMPVRLPEHPCPNNVDRNVRRDWKGTWKLPFHLDLRNPFFCKLKPSVVWGYYGTQYYPNNGESNGKENGK